MDPRVTPSASPLQHDMRQLCDQDYSPSIKAEPYEQQHLFRTRQLSGGCFSKLTGASTHIHSEASLIHSTNEARSSLSLSHSSNNSNVDQKHHSLPGNRTYAPSSHDLKVGSFGHTSSDRDQSFQHQQRIHRNQQQNNQQGQSHQDHGRVPFTLAEDHPRSGLGNSHPYQHQFPSNLNRQQHQHHSSNTHPHTHHHHHHPQQQQQQQQQQQHASISGQGMPAAQRLPPSTKRRMTKEKAPKGDREEVWPPDVEGAFMKALEVLPKLGRRKVLVNGKPCGRNELIADFIYQQTQKVRDRKQVSSHIQVLKNTRKHDPAFMRLLMDSGDGEEEIETANSGCISTSHSPIPSPHLQYDRMEHSLFDDRTQQTQDANLASPSTSGFESPSGHYPSYPGHSPFRHQYSQHPHHARVKSFTSPEGVSDHVMAYGDLGSRSTSVQSVYQQSVTTPDSAVSLSSEIGGLKDSMIFDQQLRDSPPIHLSAHTSASRDLFRTAGPPRSSHSLSPLWPTAFGLFIQHPGLDVLSAEQRVIQNSDTTGTGQSNLYIHELARAQDLGHLAFGSISIHQLPSEKFPSLYDLYEKAPCAFLFFKIGMNLNLALEGTFENTCLFDSNEHRTMRCLTLIYSFGAKVLESTEVKQAAFVDGKFVHSFEFVNQFFNAFLSGIRTLGTAEEVEVALCNLSLVQIYEDVDSRMEGGSPLLVMAFDFEKGHGTVAPYHIVDGSDMLDTLVC